jgi:hypothetical protein
MRIETGKFTILTPSDGKYLTNGDTYSTKVYLGKNASPDGWWEVDEIAAEEEMDEPDLDETAAKAAAYDILTGGAQ